MKLKTLFGGIADAIREKDGTEAEIVASTFPERIRAIQNGNGVTLEGIEITTPPNKVSYSVGDFFDPTGMSVWASFSNGYGLYVNHSDLTFEPNGLLEESTETVTVRFSWGQETASTTQAVSVSSVHIYGAVWDGSSTTKWTRTDEAANFADPVPYVAGASNYGSPFDNLQPWAGMTRVTDSVAGELVAIPKFYYKWTKNGNSLALQIADRQMDGFKVSPAHADRGDGKGERDVVYVGRYHCAGGYTSKTDASPQVSITRSAARTKIHNLGTTIWQFDYAMRVTIQMLYLVEFADWDSQTKVGYGCGNNSARQNTGASDTMPYHTGTMQTSRTTYGVGVQYRYIEGLWDSVHDWMDGCYYNGSGMNIITNPDDFQDTSGGALIGKPSTGYPSAIAVATATGLEWAIYPASGSGGSSSAYVADNWGYGASYPCLSCGGGYGQSQDSGLFYVNGNITSNTSARIGCRLQKLP